MAGAEPAATGRRSDRGQEVVAVILKGYPRLSETFIAQEIRELERRGLTLALYSLRLPTDRKRHPVHDEIAAPVNYLPEYLYRQPLRVVRGWLHCRRLPGYRPALRTFLADLRRDASANRVRRFGQAMVLARELAPGVGHLYSHFLHTPSSVTRYAAAMRGLPWSFSAHAKDIWTIPEWEKREKIADAAWGVTCTAYGHAHLNALAGGAAPDKVALVYHGVDLTRFAPPGGGPRGGDGSAEAAPVTIVSVGRLVAKKGYDTLIDALALLPRQLNWRFVHIGGGDLGPQLRRRAEAAGIGSRVDWRGAQSQAEVIAALRASDIFVLLSRIDGSGDRDGLPNVLMEAQTQALACLATNVAAIPELIIPGETGILVLPDDPGACAAELERLIGDPELRARLGAAGAQRVRSTFSHDVCIDALAAKFALPRAAAGQAAE